MGPVYGFAVARPRTTLALALLLLAVAAPGIARLELRTDGRALVPAGAPEIAVDREVRALFGLADLIALVVEAPGERDVYDAGTLERVARLTRELQELDALEPRDVVSLATEPGLEVFPGSLDFRPWLDPLPRSAEELEQLRAELEDVGLYAGTLLSTEGAPTGGARATAILVRVREGVDRLVLQRALRAVIERHGDAPETLHLVGAPLAETQLGRHLLADLARLLPLSVLGMALVFLLAFRRVWAVALPMLEVGAALVATFGVMGWSGTPVYLTVAVLPVILVAIGVSDEVHLFHAYLRELAQPRLADSKREPRLALRHALDEVWRPLARTTVTTAAAFLTFALSPLPPVRAFGLFLALGIALCFLASMTLIPACLRLLPAARLRPAAGRGQAAGEWLARLARLAAARRRPVLAAASLLLIAASFCAARVRVDDSWLAGFAPDSELRRSTEWVDGAFGGTHLLRLHVDGRGERRGGKLAPADLRGEGALLRGLGVEDVPMVLHARCTLRVETGAGREPLELPLRVTAAALENEGILVRLEHRLGSLERVLPSAATDISYTLDSHERLLQPALLDAVAELERFLEFPTLGVGRVLGPASYLETTAYLRSGRAPGTRVLPDSGPAARALVERFADARGEHELRELFTPELDGGLVTVFLERATFATTARLLALLRAYEREHLAPLGLALRPAGDIAESQALIASIVSTQRRSLLASLVLLMVLAGALLRSPRKGVICVLPATAAVLLVFGGMALTGTALGVASSMFAAMTLGLGVDQTLHLFERRRLSLAAGHAPPAALENALREAGPPVLVDGCAVALGFGVLATSNVPLNAQLGAVALVSLGACLGVTLIVFPALLGQTEP